MPMPIVLPVTVPALIFAVTGSDLTCETSSAEAADKVWRARSQWLLLWPVDRLVLRWRCPDTNEQVELQYERGSNGPAAAPSALALG